VEQGHRSVSDFRHYRNLVNGSSCLIQGK
jgi:hypothetical protein